MLKLALNSCIKHLTRPRNETSAAYYSALTSKNTPSIIALTRQNMPQLAGSSIERAAKGGYTCQDVESGKKADITIVSTGSEVGLCLKAAQTLREEKSLLARVVSMPCQEVFDAQEKAYKLSVLAPRTPILSVEALSTQGWDKV